MNLTIAHLVEPAQGEMVSGDAVLIRQEPVATVLAVIDVLGHGPEAAKVAERACRHLAQAPIRRAADLMMSLHADLHGTRGAAASICVIRGVEIDGCGVGNVDIRVLGTPLGILLTPGIIGQRLHRLREFSGKLRVGDRVVFFSDGISSQVPLSELKGLPPRLACAAVMQRHRKRHDDASVLVADLEPAHDRRQ